MGEFDHSTEVQRLLDLLRCGDPTARCALIAYTFERLRRLARRMFRREQDLRALLETDDLLQNAAVRLHRSLPEVQPATVRRFFGLAAEQIRRELIDLARHYLGSDRSKAEQIVYLGNPASRSHHPVLEQQPTDEGEPETLIEWAEFHEEVAELPEEEREVFHLIWYQDMTQGEAAEVLQVSVRTVKRRWRSAKLHLDHVLQGEWPVP